MSALERRLRGLLLAYPASHRAVHGEEMIGVLLQCAAPGQTRPGLRDGLDLVRGGLRVRSRRALGGAWADAANVTGLVALLLMSTLTPMAVYFGPVLAQDPGENRALGFVGALPWLVWPAVLVLAWFGARRIAVGLGLVALVAGHAIVWEQVSFQVLGIEGAWRLLGYVALVGAAHPGGPRAAARSLGGWRAATVTIGALALGAFHTVSSSYGQVNWPSSPLPGDAGQQLWPVFFAGAALTVFAVLSGSGGRRATWLLALPLALVVVEIARQAGPLDPRYTGVMWEHGVAIAFTAAAGVVLLSSAIGAVGRRESVLGE